MDNKAETESSKLDETINSFLDHCRHNRGLSPNTLKAYRLDLQSFSSYANSQANEQGSLPPKKVIIKYLQSISKNKPRTVNRKIASINSLAKYLTQEGLIPKNPIRDLNLRRKVPFDLPRLLSNRELKLILKSPKENKRGVPEKKLRDQCILECLYSTGMRVGELSKLKVQDINLAEKTIKVTGKGSKQRMVPICGKGTLSTLGEYLRQLGPEPEDHLFKNQNGNRLSEQSIRLLLRKHCRELGIPKVTPHTFRHTIATQLLENGTDIRYIQKFLGHSSIVTTTIYASVSDQSQKKAISSKHPRDKIQA